MSLKKNIELSVGDYSIQLSSPLKLYRGDVVTLVFKLKQIGYEIVTEPMTGMSYRKERSIPIYPLSGILLIEGPKNQDSVNFAEVYDDTIVFKLGTDHTQNLGMSRMQIILESEDDHRVALPEFDFEIREIIAEYENGSSQNGIKTHNEDIIITHNGDRIIFTE